MHAARHGWDLDKDAPLFMNWAIHTGIGSMIIADLFKIVTHYLHIIRYTNALLQLHINTLFTSAHPLLPHVRKRQTHNHFQWWE